MENSFKMDDLGVPLFSETSYIVSNFSHSSKSSIFEGRYKMYESIYSKKNFPPQKKGGWKTCLWRYRGDHCKFGVFFLGGGKSLGISLCARMSMEVSN